MVEKKSLANKAGFNAAGRLSSKEFSTSIYLIVASYLLQELKEENYLRQHSKSFILSKSSHTKTAQLVSLNRTQEA
jgi:hypothetical protein